MEENNTKFKILDENNIEREADVVTVIEVEGKEYVVYSIDTDSENCDVLVSRLEALNEGYILLNNSGTDEIFDIEDEIEREKIHNIVNELLNA